MFRQSRMNTAHSTYPAASRVLRNAADATASRRLLQVLGMTIPEVGIGHAREAGEQAVVWEGRKAHLAMRTRSQCQQRTRRQRFRKHTPVRALRR